MIGVLGLGPVDRPFSTDGQLMCHEEMHRQMPMIVEDFWFYRAVFGP
jgi:hypothetical protein